MGQRCGAPERIPNACGCKDRCGNEEPSSVEAVLAAAVRRGDATAVRALLRAWSPQITSLPHTGQARPTGHPVPVLSSGPAPGPAPGLAPARALDGGLPDTTTHAIAVTSPQHSQLVTVCDPEDQTKPLMYVAARLGHTEVMRAFLDYEGDIELRETVTGNYLLHAAASGGHNEAVCVLLDEHLARDSHFNPSFLRNGFSETPAQIAMSKATWHILDTFSSFCLAVDDPGMCLSHRGMLAMPPREYAIDFCRVSSVLPLIGDRHRFSGSTKKALAGVLFEDLVRGVQIAERVYRSNPKHAEQVRFLELREQFCGRGRSDSTSTRPTRMWKCHWSAEDITKRLTAQWLRWGDSEESFTSFAIEVVQMYTVESFLARSLDDALLSGAQATGSETPPSGGGRIHHLVPFAVLLHRSLLHLSATHSWRGECYRAMRLSNCWLARLHMCDKEDREREQVEADARGTEDHPRGFSAQKVYGWDGIVTAVKSASSAWNDLVRSRGNCLFIIKPMPSRGAGSSGKKCGRTPFDAAAWCAQGPGDSRVVFPPGQHFMRRRAYRVTPELLRRRLLEGAPPEGGPPERFKEPEGDAPKEVTVIELYACDLFWEMSADLFDDGGAEDETAQVLKNKIRHDAALYQEGCGVIAKAKGFRSVARILADLACDMSQADETRRAERLVRTAMEIERESGMSTSTEVKTAIRVLTMKNNTRQLPAPARDVDAAG